MSWKDKMKEFGGGDLSFLSEDGETIKFIVVGEPILLEGEYKGTPSQKIGCPVVTEDGFVLFIAGKRLARKISKHEAEFGSRAFMAVRHGERDDSNAAYDLKVLDDKELVERLFNLHQLEFKPEMIDEAVTAAQEVMKK
ncbi:unnamed protein product [marine sediment metagenome]|uniref:Uncharacterized protein n=1 Tax=marine sediment metagenome TaxID=412755 RepID=X1IVI2_9ZZZZ